MKTANLNTKKNIIYLVEVKNKKKYKTLNIKIFKKFHLKLYFYYIVYMTNKNKGGSYNTHTEKFRPTEKRTITCKCGFEIVGQKRDVNLRIKLHKKVCLQKE